MSIMNLFNGGGSVRSRTNRPNMRDIAGPIRDTINPRRPGKPEFFNQEQGKPAWMKDQFNRSGVGSSIGPGGGILRREDPSLPPWHQNNLGEGSFWNVKADQPRQDSGVMMALANSPGVNRIKSIYNQIDPFIPNIDIGDQTFGYDLNFPLLGGDWKFDVERDIDDDEWGAGLTGTWNW